jgi:hypothetical protein
MADLVTHTVSHHQTKWLKGLLVQCVSQILWRHRYALHRVLAVLFNCIGKATAFTSGKVPQVTASARRTWHSTRHGRSRGFGFCNVHSRCAG